MKKIILCCQVFNIFNFVNVNGRLIHIEQQWEENVRTIEGQYLHQKADQPFIREKRGNKLIVRAMPVKSNELKTYWYL